MIRSLTLAALIALSPVLALAEEWALGGYDAVAFVTEGRAVPGKAGVTTSWRGKQYHFASEAHRAQFEANPRAYLPGFGGLCVVALAEGRSEPGDPQYFLTIGKRLYFVGSARRHDQLMDDPRGLLMQAKNVWLKLNH